MNRTISNPQYLGMLEKCSSFDQLKQIHAQTITTGLARFSYITSKLLAFASAFDIIYAHTILNRITTPTTFDYNSLILAYSKTPKQQTGILLYSHMCNKNIKPNARTFPVLIKTCDCLNMLVQVHAQVVKNGEVVDGYVTSSLISMYSGYKAVELAKRVFEESLFKNVVCCTSLITGCFSNGLVEDACKVFDEMPERNDVSYNAMVSGFVKNELYNEAIQLYFQMMDCGLVSRHRSLLASMLNACGAVGAFDLGRSIHCRLVEGCFNIDVEFGTALIDFYAKCGDIEKAKDIFNNIVYKDVATWSAMILGLATNGENETAIDLFEEMEQRGPIPNGITFVAVLVACNHKTLLTKPWCLLGKMSKVYNMELTIEHYGCMVDLLARSGQLTEAEILIKLMPMAPDGAIWGSFLHGCLTYDEMHLVETAGKSLIELEPKHSGRYVGLANMYANNGSWEGVIKLRKMMTERKVAIAPGWSFIEVNGIVNKFFVDDQCHPQARDIHNVTDSIRMSSATFTTTVTGSINSGWNPNGSKLYQTTNLVPWSRKTVSNGSRIHCMKVWNPINNKKFETLSYLPPLTDESIAKEIDYMMKKGWVPCLEFDSVGHVFRENSRIPNYYDGRYWTLWKLPMFGCTDSSQVLNEIQECKKTYPNAYIRCLAFDNVRQSQCMSFVIQKPADP